MTRRRRLAAAGALALGLMVPAGCVSLPESGPVTSIAARTEAPHEDGGPDYYSPPLPKRGESETGIVQGFLNAMRQTPVSTAVAREYLTPEFAAAWNPARETITYAHASPPNEAAGGKVGDDGAGRINVFVSGANHVDKHGEWRGPLPAAQRVLGFRLVKTHGEIRIDKAPNALVVPDGWFATNYSQVSLYFFDPTASILVPEPVFVPQNDQAGQDQLATSLVAGLLGGPAEDLPGSSRSFLPSGLTTGLSVPVSKSGVANVVLKGAAQVPSEQDVERITAQLVWTLRQDPSITEVGVDIGGDQLTLPGGRPQVSVDGSYSYDPIYYDTTDRLFGLRHGVLLSGASPTTLRAVAGPFGTAHKFRSVSVDLTGTKAVGVTIDGTAVWAAPLTKDRLSAQGTTITSRPRVVVRGAADLLRPAWDFSGGRFWLVDRTAHGAQVSVNSRGTSRVVAVPGISGMAVRKFLVSHDGSRLIAIVHSDAGDEVVVSRIQHDANGGVTTVGRAVRISTPDLGDRIQDIGWSSPTSLLVLTRIGDNAQVRTISVDGAPTGSGGLTVTVPLDARLVSSPSSSTPGTDKPFALTPGDLADLNGSDATPVPIDADVSDLFYAG